MKIGNIILIVQVLLIALKIANIITWSWIITFLPIILPLGCLSLMIVAYLFMCIITGLCEFMEHLVGWR